MGVTLVIAMVMALYGDCHGNATMGVAMGMGVAIVIVLP